MLSYGIVIEVVRPGQQESAVASRGARRDVGGIKANHGFPTCQQFLNHRKPAAAESDDTGARGYGTVEWGEASPRAVVPHGDIRKPLRIGVWHYGLPTMPWITWRTSSANSGELCMD